MSMSSATVDVFPSRLRAAREERGLNQADLAARAGLQASAISHFESGTRRPSFDNLKRLSDALSVPTDYLLGRISALDEKPTADVLYRDFERLSAADKDFARDMIAKLAQRNR